MDYCQWITDSAHCQHIGIYLNGLHFNYISSYKYLSTGTGIEIESTLSWNISITNKILQKKLRSSMAALQRLII